MDTPKRRTPKERHRRAPKERPPDPNRVEAEWRLFVALPLADDVRALVEGVVAELQPHGWPVRWSGADSAHVTLHFLGEVAPERAQLLRMALPAVVRQHEPFKLRTTDLGAFPDVMKPRVLWLGLAGETHRLTALSASVAKLLRSLDMEADDRPLRPHITLGRVRDDPPADLAAKIRRGLDDPSLRDRLARDAAPVVVDEIVLYRSILERDGTRHEALVRCPLRSAGS